MRYIDGAELPLSVLSIVVVISISAINSTEFITLQKEKSLHHVFHIFYAVFSVFTIVVLLIDILSIVFKFRTLDISDYGRRVVYSLTHSVTIIICILWIAFLSVEVLFNTRQIYRNSLFVLLALYILLLSLKIPAFIDIPEYEYVEPKGDMLSMIRRYPNIIRKMRYGL